MRGFLLFALSSFNMLLLLNQKEKKFKKIRVMKNENKLVIFYMYVYVSSVYFHQHYWQQSPALW